MEDELKIIIPTNCNLRYKFSCWLKNNTTIITVIGTLLIIFSIYDILAYYDILPPIARSNSWSPILLDLSLSIVGGSIIYFLTSVLPKWQKIRIGLKETEAILKGLFMTDCWKLSTVVHNIEPQFTFLETQEYKLLDINCLINSKIIVNWNKTISLFEKAYVPGLKALSITLDNLKKSSLSIYHQHFNYLNSKTTNALKTIINSDIYEITRFYILNMDKEVASNVDQEQPTTQQINIKDYNTRLKNELIDLYESFYSIYGIQCVFRFNLPDDKNI